MKTLRIAAVLAILLALLAPLAAAAALAKAAPGAAKSAPAAARPSAPTATAPAAQAPAAAAPAATAAAPEDLIKVADEVAKDVEALRGWKFKEPVKKQLVTEEQARAWLEKEVEKQAPPALLAKKQAFLRMVGLLPPDCELKKTLLALLQGQIAGYYDPDTKTLSLVNRTGMPRAGLVERIMLSHELTHALDDQYADLGKFVKDHGGKSEDGDLVVASVFEGSATAEMMRYTPRLQMTGRFDLSELMAYAQQEEAHNRAFLEAPRYFSVMLATYMCGMSFLARGSFMSIMMGEKDVGDDFLAAVKDPPRSSKQVLHPEKYWDSAKRDEPVLVADDDVKNLLAGSGRVVVHADTLGEMLCAILTSPKDAKPDMMSMVTSAGWTNPAVAAWLGDRFYLLAAGSSAEEAAKSLKDPRGLWITLWDSAKGCDDFLQALDATSPNPARTSLKWGSQGAVFFFGFTDAERKDLEAKLQKSPPKMTRDAKPWTPWTM
jgi:hypothetical protein